MITRNQAALYDVQWATIFGTNYFPLELLTGRLAWEVSEDVHIAATPDVKPTEKGPALTKYEQAKKMENRAEFANLLGTLIEDKRKWNDYVQFKDESGTVTSIEREDCIKRHEQTVHDYEGGTTVS